MNMNEIDDEICRVDAAADISDEQIEKLGRLITDGRAFIENVLHIQNKEGQLVPFHFNSAQERLLDEIERQKKLEQPVRIIILKARQMGFSTAVSGVYYHRTITTKNTISMIVAHKADASTNIFNKAKLFYETSPMYLQPYRKASNAKELLFENPTTSPKEKRINPGLRSKIIIETAANKDAGRSATIHNLHISELAFWPNPEETMTSLMQAVPNHKNTIVIIESTANGIGDKFYEEWMRAERGESVFVPMFFPWFEDPEYAMPLPPDYQITDEEAELKAAHDLTDEQIVWRRWCIKANCSGDIDKFHQEYPSTPHEAFLSSGRPVFDVTALERALQKVEPPKYVGRVINENGRAVFRSAFNGYLKIWEMPKDGHEYIIGADTASGKAGGDFSVAYILDRQTEMQVAEWHGHIAPDLFGQELNMLGRFYNLAWLIPEVNNTGISTIDELRRQRYSRIYRRRSLADDVENKSKYSYGFYTSAKTKPLMINNQAAFIRDKADKIRSKDALRECMTYVYDDKGATNAQQGCHDDRVIGMGLALFGLKERPWSKESNQDFSNIHYLYNTDSVTGY